MDSMTRYTLTTQDVRALRHADSICFDHNVDGTAHIRAIVRADRSSSGFEQTHVIPCEGRVDDYEQEHTQALEHRGYRAFHMEMSARYSDTAQSLVGRLRAGNAIILRWTRGNSSPVTKEIGFVRDELRLRTGNPERDNAETFLVAVYAGYDNTARMVRRG